MKFENLELPSNQKFGYFFSVILFITTIYFFYIESIKLCLIFFSISLTFLTVTILRPQLLRYLNISWMFIGYLIGLIVSPIVLGLIFYLLITPLSIFLKLINRDELELKEAKNKSFWKPRNNILDSIRAFRKQF